MLNFDLVVGAVAAFLAGGLLWTLTEYLAHRFLGHHRKTRPNPFADEHTRHHSVGDYFAPAWKKAVVAIVAFALVGIPAVALTGGLIGAAFALGFAALYVGYEALHWRAHTHAGRSLRMPRLRRHHFYHHFGDPRVNHGVSTTLWDRVFNTHVVPQQIPVPHKMAMRWLFADAAAREEGRLLACFSAHYRIVGRAHPPVSTVPAVPTPHPPTPVVYDLSDSAA